MFCLVYSYKIEARIKLYENKRWEVVYSDFKEDDIYVATAFYNDSFAETGWDTLSISISTNYMFSDEIQA